MLSPRNTLPGLAGITKHDAPGNMIARNVPSDLGALPGHCLPGSVRCFYYM